MPEGRYSEWVSPLQDNGHGSLPVDVYLDDERIDTSLPLCEEHRLVDLVNDIRARLFDAGRIIVAIRCNGLDVTGVGFGEALQRSISTIDRVDMASAMPESLVEEAMSNAGSLLDAAEKVTEAIVSDLTQGDVSSAMPKLQECCSAWSQVHDGICNAVSMLRINAESLSVDGRSVDQLMAGPCEQLRQVREAIEAQDFVLLSDVLTYEFPAVTDTWRKMIELVLAHMTQPSSK